MNSQSTRSRWEWILPLAVGLLGTLTATAQLPFPDLRTVSPPGAKAGETVELTIGGTHLEETIDLVFSHSGIRCEQIKIAATEFLPERHEPLRYRVTIAPDVPPGSYEIHARTRLGFTAPRAFEVGTLPEVMHAATNGNPETPMPLPLGTLVNGTADAEGIDHYLLELTRDQPIVIQCRGEPIDSRIDATLVLVDSKGRELMRDRDTLGRDALLYFTAPEDGVFTLKVFDFTYRGGAEYPYRLLASSAPHIDFIYLPAGQPGTTGKFKIYGRNLPGGSKGEGVRLGRHELESVEVEIALNKPEDDPLSVGPVLSSLAPGMEYRLASGDLASNPVRIGFATAPIVEAIESDDDQTVTVPCELHGRFDRQADMDRYRFEAKKGAELWIECLAERIGTAADPIVIIERIKRDDKGVESVAEVASNDDAGSGSGGNWFPVRTRDSFLRFTPQEDGLHRISVLNQVGRGGAAALYRLVVQPVAQDFDLIATPWHDFQPDKRVSRTPALLRRGGTCQVRVFAMRRNGFTGQIILSAEGLPAGVTCPPVTIKADKDFGDLYLKCPEDAPDWQGFISIKGTAGEAVREARSGAISWSVGDWDQDWSKPRLSKRLALSVCADEKAPIIVLPPEQQRYEVELDGTLELPIKLVKNFGLKGELLVRPDGLPYAKNPPQIKLKPDANEGKLTFTFKKTAEFPISPGEWQFTIRAEGIVQHRNNLAGIARAEQEQKRIEELEKTFLDEATKVRAAVEPAKQSVQEAEKTVQSASAESKAQLEVILKEKQAALKTAEDAAVAAEEKSKRAGAAKTAAAERVKQAGERAKVAEVKHAAYSLPITVIIKPPPPKEEGK